MTSPWPEQFDLELELDSSEATVELQPVPASPRRERPPRRTARGDLARLLAGAARALRRRITILRADIPAYERQRRALAAGVLLVLLIALLSTGGGSETAPPPEASAAEPAAPEQAAPAEAEPAALSLNAGTLLRPGDRSSEVRRLQEALLALDLSKAKPDGVFGKKTTRAVKTFQRQAGLEADGVVGPKTAEALNRALAGLP